MHSVQLTCQLRGQTDFHTFVCLTCASQESRKLKEGSLLDRLLYSVKERRMKQYRAPNQK